MCIQRLGNGRKRENEIFASIRAALPQRFPSPVASPCSELCVPVVSGSQGKQRGVALIVLPYLGRSGESPSLRVRRTARTRPCAPARPRPRGSTASRRRSIPMCVVRLLQNGWEPRLGSTSRPNVVRLDLSSRRHPLLRLNDKHLGTGRRRNAPLASPPSFSLHHSNGIDGPTVTMGSSLIDSNLPIAPRF
jgi:hypothetical protein